MVSHVIYAAQIERIAELEAENELLRAAVDEARQIYINWDGEPEDIEPLRSLIAAYDKARKK